MKKEQQKNDHKAQEVKTLQECKDLVARSRDYVKWEGSDYATDGMIDEVAELYASQFKNQSTQEWISVKDRLPETEGDYLCGKQYKYGQSFIQAVYEFKFYRMSDTGELVVSDGETGVFQDALAYGQDVTYWQPLPQKPTEI